MECLTGSFTGMKLNLNGGGATKRDRVTIEGSPMVPLPFKQPNLNSTPYKSEEEWNIHDFYSSGPTGIGFPTNPSSPQHTLQTDEHEAVDAVKIDPAFHTSPVRDIVQQKPKQEHLQKVLVICSASSEHNTGDHQENMLRTALLCGDKGCLRRPELAEYIDWVDSDTIQAAPLCDLLRCVMLLLHRMSIITISPPFFQCARIRLPLSPRGKESSRGRSLSGQRDGRGGRHLSFSSILRTPWHAGHGHPSAAPVPGGRQAILWVGLYFTSLERATANTYYLMQRCNAGRGSRHGRCVEWALWK